MRACIPAEAGQPASRSREGEFKGGSGKREEGSATPKGSVDCHTPKSVSTAQGQ